MSSNLSDGVEQLPRTPEVLRLDDWLEEGHVGNYPLGSVPLPAGQCLQRIIRVPGWVQPHLAVFAQFRVDPVSPLVVRRLADNGGIAQDPLYQGGIPRAVGVPILWTDQVKVVDGSTTIMPDTLANQKEC